jgi:hypothetical protein
MREWMVNDFDNPPDMMGIKFLSYIFSVYFGHVSIYNFLLFIFVNYFCQSGLILNIRNEKVYLFLSNYHCIDKCKLL